MTSTTSSEMSPATSEQLRAMYKLTRQRLVPVFEVNGRALVRPGNVELAEFLL